MTPPRYRGVWIAGVLTSLGIAAVAVANPVWFDDTEGSSQRSASRASPGTTATADPERAAGDRDAPVAANGAPPPDVDDDPLRERWDLMSIEERAAVQRRRFADSIADARRGVEVRRNLAQARDALTLLRPELYRTKRGRSEHHRLEEQYETVAERRDSTRRGPRP